ncbi:serralysin [Gammaproteobacteria bacterium LSUCC0057]|uniref:Serralysin n=1 Tax=Gammaproteobacteria bacterium LSUCC0057 TaxID=2559237 RepID=A0A4Y8ULK2_9GAMM|nr:serralysin [Gammaproteobacteria bacterium LSUCC0057]
MSPLKQKNQLEWLSELNNLFQREMPQHRAGLYEAANYHFNSPGKLLRAQLALAAGNALGLQHEDNLHWAAACEILHNASLVHDDISDSSTHRRGQKSIREFYGADTALCLGDWMVAKAFELAARNRQFAGPLVALLAHSMQETCNGQISDVSQSCCADLSQWMTIAQGKTAPLLLAPIQGAAIASGLELPLDSLNRLVVLCSLAYQGRNDINDIIPSSHRSSDLEGRKPNLVVSLFNCSQPSEQEFTRWYQSGDNTQLEKWQRHMATSDVIFEANQRVDGWLAEGETLIAKLPSQLQAVARQLLLSAKLKAATSHQERIA